MISLHSIVSIRLPSHTANDKNHHAPIPTHHFYGHSLSIAPVIAIFKISFHLRQTKDSGFKLHTIFLLLYKKKERHAAQAPALRERYRDPVSGILDLASSIY